MTSMTSITLRGIILQEISVDFTKRACIQNKNIINYRLSCSLLSKLL